MQTPQNAPPPSWAQDILHCWFTEFKRADWFRKSDQIDRLLQERFEGALVQQGGRPASHFLDQPKTAQAAILLFDQIPRNIYRGTAKAFAYDPLARELSHAFLAKGWDQQFPDSARQFIAMPLMHSEILADQEASLAYFTAHLPGNIRHAQSHYEMIKRFGRFPHRNTALGRKTTPAEQQAIADGFSW